MFQMEIVGVDLDSAVILAGKRWFGLMDDDRLRCEIADGIKYMEKAFERKLELVMTISETHRVSDVARVGGRRLAGP